MNIDSINYPYKAFIFCVIGVLLFPCLHGTTHTNRIFYNINNIHGVSLRGTNSVCEDEYGFIWVSSKTGVFRITEDDFRSYHLPYITADVLSVKLVYGVSGLIAYTNNGQFFKYNNLYDRFDFLFDLRELLNFNRIYINRVLIEKDGSLIIASSFGLHRYNNDNQINLLGVTNSNDYYIEWYNNNKLFIGREEGIEIFDTKSGDRQQILFNSVSKTTQVTSLFYDDFLNRLLIGTISGRLIYLDLDELIFIDGELNNTPNHPILAIEANTDSTIMLGYDGQGLWEINREGTRVLNIYREDVDNPLSLQGNGVYDIFMDRNQRIWVCTYSGGVSFFEQSPVEVTQIRHLINDENSLINNVVNDVYEDSSGNVWFATNNGISRWHQETNTWNSFLNSNTGQIMAFLSIIEDSNGYIWAGTWSDGIYVLNAETGATTNHYFTSGVRQTDFGNSVFDIMTDISGDIWLAGVMEYVTKFNPQNKEIVQYGYEPVYVIKELNDYEMLLGCTFGLVLLNKMDGKQEIILEGYIIHDILVLDDVIWCCTSGGGLIKLNISDRSYHRYTIDSGLPSNFINSIYNANDYFWLGTENGLCRFCPVSEEVLNYASIIQLSNVSFNPGAVHSLNNYHLIFGTNQGAIMFNPYTLRPRHVEGQIFIQDIIISGSTIRNPEVYELSVPVDSLESLSLSFNRRTVTFELLPKGVSAPDSKISWKFDGLDDVWSTPSSNRIVTFANLPIGKHALKIRMYNNSVSQIIDERSIYIKVEPPIWGTWWFYLLVIIIAVGIIYFSFRYHISLLQKLHSEEKIDFFANTTHEIRTSLTLISAPIEELRKEDNVSIRGKYYLALASEQVGNLLKVATQLLDFQKFDKGKGQLRLRVINIVELIKQRIAMFESFAEKNHVILILNSAVESRMTAVDIDAMSKVIDNLISNAIKYSHKGGEVIITLFNNKESWGLSIKDEGIGINSKGKKQLFKEFYRSENAVNSEMLGSGIGLLMVKNFVEKHNGKVSFTSEENVGSVFTIEIPYLTAGESLFEDFNNEDKVTDSEIYFQDMLIANSESISEKYNDIDVLVVENNDNLREFMKVALGDSFNVQTVDNGRIAWELVKKNLPDLVISDVMMPEMDGFELCRLMKSTNDTSHIPVIFLTALSEKAEQLHGIGLGADAYLTKPFDLTLLIQRINSIILNRKVIREKALRLIDHEPDDPIMENELNDQFVKKALVIVRSNIGNANFSKEIFANEMNVSSSLLYKKVKSLTDQSPTDFIKSIRLKEAIRLLNSRKHSITEVSEMCGFSSVGYFSTVFKKYYGKTPSEYLEF